MAAINNAKHYLIFSGFNSGQWINKRETAPLKIKAPKTQMPVAGLREKIF